MTRKQPTPVPPGAIKPDPPPAPPLFADARVSNRRVADMQRAAAAGGTSPSVVPPPLRSEPVYNHEGVEIPRPGSAYEIEEALRQLVEALPGLYDEVGEGTMDAVRHAQRVLGIEVDEPIITIEEITEPPPTDIWVDVSRGRDWWWRSGKNHRKPLRTISAATRRAKPYYVIRVVSNG
ncbi:hypothetical protein LCGC14_1528740 [marine sediment metagenome]|uniref:Uncharacterized protein n=1 Tax=marine sediment metagenome TaxID=412755 RepID=A0A0F9LC34_9ZZZZ